VNLKPSFAETVSQWMVNWPQCINCLTVSGLTFCHSSSHSPVYTNMGSPSPMLGNKGLINIQIQLAVISMTA